MEIGERIKLCACGCGEWIIYKKHHKWYGIPNYISDHDKKVNPTKGMLGKHHSPERIEKMRNFGKKRYLEGNFNPPLKNKKWEEFYGDEKSKRLKKEMGERAKKQFTGKPKSGEHLRKLRERLILFNKSDSQRSAVSKFRTGRAMDPETINKIKLWYRDNPNPRIENFKGKHFSLKTEWKKGQNAGDKNYAKLPEVRAKIKEWRSTFVSPTKDTKIEVRIQNFLKELNIDFFTHQYIQEIKHKYQCDILIPSINLIIECDGNYWHKYPIGKDLDHIRTKELIEKGFKVLRLWESEINNMDLEKFKSIMKEMIK